MNARPSGTVTTCDLRSLLVFLVLIAGCGRNSSFYQTSTATTPPFMLKGKVIGGQQPVTGGTIQLYAAGSSGYGTGAAPLLAPALTTDLNGNFSIPNGYYSCPAGNPETYIVATGGDPGIGANNPAIALMAALGPCSGLSSSTYVDINEVTTVGSVWPLAPFMGYGAEVGTIAANQLGLATAFVNVNSLVNISTGLAPGTSVPQGVTIPVAEINTIADILASCINSNGATACSALFAATTPSSGPVPTNTLDAALNMALNPGANVAALFALSTPSGPFQPTLTSQPSNWMLGNAITTNPVPSISNLSPSSLQVGSTPQTLTINGTGFLSTSAVTFNGISRTATYVSANQLTLSLTSTDLASAASYPVVVTNPVPGGGSSTAVSFSVVSQSTFLRSINLPANDIKWDATHGLIYASLPSSDTNGNSVVAIDPVAGTAGTPQPAGSNPDPLAISGDASYLYVGLDGTGAVERFNLPSMTLDTGLSLQLPISSEFGQQVALSLAAAPGSPHTIAAILGNYSWGPPNTGGTVVYDDATPRPANIPFNDASDSSLQWGSTASVLYANDAFDTGNDLYAMSVNSSGLTLKSDYGYLVPTQYGRIHFDPSSGYIYADGGLVVNPSTGNDVGNFNLGALVGYYSPLCAPDTQNGVIYFLGQTSAQYSAGSGVTIQAFDAKTYQLLATLPVPEVTGFPGQFLRWGNAGLAFTAGTTQRFAEPPQAGPIYLIDGSFVMTTLPVDSTAGAALNTLPVLTSISPQSVIAGATDLTLNVTGSNFESGTTVTWNGAALQTAINSVTELQATVPSGDLAAAGSAVVSVSSGSPAEPAINSLAFTILPASSGPTSVTALNLASMDVAWDASSGLIFLPVWSADPQYPNSIVAVNPSTGTITQSVGVLPNPDLVRVTADGALLYTAFATDNWATQMTLPDLGSPMSWPLGADPYSGPYFAWDLQPAPGASQTTAVDLAVKGSEPFEQGGITIYDNGAARPTSVPGFGQAGGKDFDSLQWGASSSSLYAGDGSEGFYSLDVNSSGVTLGQSYPVEFTSSGANIDFDAGTGYIYSDDGQVINPANGSLVGTYNASGLLVPDSSLNRVFILGQLAGQSGTDNYTLQSFNETTFASVSSITVSSLVGTPVAIIRWGANGLALVTNNKNASTTGGPAGMLYIISDTSFVSANSTPSILDKPSECVHSFARMTKKERSTFLSAR